MTTFSDLKIWDGENLLEADAISIQGHSITWLGSSDEIIDKTSARSMHGATLIPGLIDAHVHLELDPEQSKAPTGTAPNVITLMAERAEKMVRAGITTARDLGGGAWYELALRDQIHHGQVTGPRLICAGQPITCTQGHCHFWGGEADTLEAAHQVLDRQVAKGVDLIKIMATGGRMTSGSNPSDAQFEQPVMDSLVHRAHTLDLPVAAHCHGTEGIKRAALAGVDTIEHCSWVGQEGWASDYQAEVASIILDNGIWVSPTVNKGWQRMLDSQTGTVLKRVRAAYRAMLDMGIPMLASTDAGIPGVFHADLPHALVVFAAIAQLDNAATLRSATSDAARCLRLDHVTGSIRTGLEADLLFVDGNPLEHLPAITKPVAIYARGQQVV